MWEASGWYRNQSFFSVRGLETGKVLPLPEPHDPGGCTNVSDDTATREIASEQAFVDRVYVQLQTSAAAAQQLAREGHDRGRLGHAQALEESKLEHPAIVIGETPECQHEGPSGTT